MTDAEMEALFDLLEQSTLYSGTNKMFSYVKSNPAEAALVERYWRDGGTSPKVVTKFGRFLVYTADALRPSPSGYDLQAMIDGTPNGGTVLFPSGDHLVSQTLNVTGRSNLTITGNNTRILGKVGDGHRPIFQVTNGSNITFRDLWLDGGYYQPGHHNTDLQFSHGIMLLGVNGALIEDCTIRNVGGDGIYAGLGTTWCIGVDILDCTIYGTGRNAVAAVAVTDILVDGGTYGTCGWNVFDVEPNTGAAKGVDGAIFRNATCGDHENAVCLGVVGDNQADNLTFTNLTVTAATGAVCRVGTVVGRRRANITYSNITATTAAPSVPDAIGIQRTDGVVVTGNVIPSGGGVMLICTDNTAVTFSGNTPNTSSGC